ncbi:MAG: right-handed parallel beta-helix repeat-containing protein [Chloroflexota bacterium]
MRTPSEHFTYLFVNLWLIFSLVLLLLLSIVPFVASASAFSTTTDQHSPRVVNTLRYGSGDITVTDSTLTPAVLTLQAGTEVSWINSGSLLHQGNSGHPALNHPLPTGELQPDNILVRLVQPNQGDEVRHASILIPAFRTEVCGTLNTSTTWTLANSPYVVTCNVTVQNSATLTIEPGTMIKMAQGTGLTVEGELIAEGTVDNKIIFTSLKDDSVGGDTNGDDNGSSPARGDWDNISLGSSGQVSLDYAEVRYGGWRSGSIVANSINSTLTIDHSVIRDSDTAGLSLHNITNATIANTTIQHNDSSGVSTSKAVFTIDNSIISNNGSVGVSVTGNTEMVSITNSTISDNNSRGIYAVNLVNITDNIISGNNSDGIHLRPNGSVSATISNNTINNNEYGLRNTGSSIVDARHNWWGDSSGPFHADTNPGGEGNAVSDGVDYIPWLEAPELVYLSPTKGGNTGNVTLTISGKNVTGESEVKLTKTGETDIIPINVISASGGLQLMVTFDLRGKTPGTWDVVITSPSNEIETLEAAFEIVNGGGGELTLDLIGPTQVRVGREAEFTIIVRNEGLSDLNQVLVRLLAQENQNEQLSNAMFTSQQIPILGESTTLYRTIPPGSSRTASIRVTFPSNLCSLIASSAEAIEDEKWNDEDIEDIKKQIRSLETKVDLQLQELQNLNYEIGQRGCVDPPYPPDSDCAWLLAQAANIKAIIAALQESISELNQQLAKCEGDRSNSYRSDSERDSAYISSEVCPVTSWDPNDKQGVLGVGDGHYINSDISLPYTVFFENLPAATAAAQEVLIIDVLDPNLEWSTFSLDTIQIGESTVSLPLGTQNFSTTVDLRPTISALVEVDLSFDPATGQAEWLFRGKDPDTGELADFLPPNTEDVAPQGEGWVSYQVTPKQGLSSGTVIKNKATIDFEVDIPPTPLDTPVVTNTIDADPPTSQVLPLDPSQDLSSFEIQWSGEDAHSGIGGYSIYVSENDGPYLPWLTNVISTSAVFDGTPSTTYSFFSRAKDNVGNMEDLRLTADATTQTGQETSPEQKLEIYFPIIFKGQ